MNDKHLRAWFVVFVLAVFTAGVGAGSILDRYLRPVVAARGGPGAPGRMRPGGERPAASVVMHRMMTDRLQLSADQQKQVEAIFASRRGRLEKIRSDINARFEAEQRDFRDEIRKVLTPDQQKRFEEWLREEPMPGMRRGGRGMRPGMGPGRGMVPGRQGPGRDVPRGPGS